MDTKKILIIVIIVVVLTVVVVVAANAKGSTNNSNTGGIAGGIDANSKQLIQTTINSWMSNPSLTAALAHEKIGGATGVPPNVKTAKAFVLAQSLDTLQRYGKPVNASGLTIDSFTYPNIESYCNPSASDGLGRDNTSLLGSVGSFISSNPALLSSLALLL